MRDCYFCKRNIKEIDYKDTETLSNFLDPLAKIKSRRQSGACAKHQRKLAKAIKKARILGLLPFTTR
ncbi:MAG: 30S ribosomal protein S18 [Patescibacteria group bacterium]